jgi:hypothetical protein
MAREEWVLLRRYDDGLTAQIALDFLRDHGVPVAVRGNSGSLAMLNRFDTVLDVRLVVPHHHLESALEALSALEAPGTPIETSEELVPISGHPYRDLASAPEISPRYRRAAFALALMMPIGSGHFYAGENVAGVVFAIAIAASALSGHALAAVLVVACDAIGSLWAVQRHNAGGEPAARSAQALRALACVAVAIAASSLVR